MLPKLLFLINPNAGHSGIRSDLLKVLELFSRSYEVTIYVTAGPGEITEKVLKEGSSYALVVVSGGDGSLNEAVRGLLQLEEPPLLGYIPAGTANDVASSLKLSLNAYEAAETVVSGKPFSMDLGTFNGRAFSYVAAFGAFTAVAYATPQKSKRVFGKLAYLTEGARSMKEISPIHAKISADGVDEEGDFLVGLFCSTTSVGGFHAGDLSKLGVSLSDGLHEAVFVRYPKNAGDLAGILAELTRKDFSDPKHFLAFHTKRVSVSFGREIPWTLDGEDGGSVREAELCDLPQALRIIVPNQ